MGATFRNHAQDRLTPIATLDPVGTCRTARSLSPCLLGRVGVTSPRRPLVAAYSTAQMEAARDGIEIQNVDLGLFISKLKPQTLNRRSNHR